MHDVLFACRGRDLVVAETVVCRNIQRCCEVRFVCACDGFVQRLCPRRTNIECGRSFRRIRLNEQVILVDFDRFLKPPQPDAVATVKQRERSHLLACTASPVN